MGEATSTSSVANPLALSCGQMWWCAASSNDSFSAPTPAPEPRAVPSTKAPAPRRKPTPRADQPSSVTRLHAPGALPKWYGSRKKATAGAGASPLPPRLPVRSAGARPGAGHRGRATRHSAEPKSARRASRSPRRSSSRAGSGSAGAGHRAPRAYTVAPVHYFNRRNHLGELYKTVTAMLLDRSTGCGMWRVKETVVYPFDLCLGESIGRGIPYSRLECDPMAMANPPLVSFYRNFKALTWKVEMVETLRRYCARQGIDVNTIIPESFVFRSKRDNSKERRRFIDSFYTAADMPGVSNVWILKPSGGGKGKDIELCDDVGMMSSQIDSIRYGRTDWVFCKYIERPLLLTGGRKFDIRTWVLLDHNYDAYLYRQGVLRTGSVAYHLEDLGDKFVHLSNHCIQENHPEYGKYEPTNEMWWHEFGEYMRLAFPEAGVSFEADILPQLRQLIVVSFEAAKDALWHAEGGGSGEYGHQSFNLFGFDFMIDEAFKVWLVEINSSPGVAKQLLHPLARDLIHTAIEPVFSPQPRATEKLPRSHSWSASVPSYATTPTTNPAGLPCCGRNCCKWGFERIDAPEEKAALLAAARAGVGIAVHGQVGVGVGPGVNAPMRGPTSPASRRELPRRSVDLSPHAPLFKSPTTAGSFRPEASPPPKPPTAASPYFP